MGLYKQAKSNNYFMRFSDEHGRLIRRSTGTADKRAATMILMDEERAVLNRKLGIAAPSPTGARAPIDVVVKRFLKEQRDNGLSESWANTQSKRFDLMISAMGIRSLVDFKTEKLKEYLVDHPTAKSHITRCQYIMHVSKLCKWAMDQSPPLLATNPAIKAMPRLIGREANVARNRVVRRPLDTLEIPLFLSAEPKTPRRKVIWNSYRLPLYQVALRTGFRRSTLRRLTPASIHLDAANPHILVPAEITKSGRSINMPLADQSVVECIDQLLRYCFARHPSDPFYGLPFGQIPKPKTFQADLARAEIPRVDELGRHVVFHSLRTTFCTQMAISGIPPQIAMELMDHKNIDVTMKIYTMVGVSDKRRFMKELPSLDCGRGKLGMSQSMLRCGHTGTNGGIC